MTQKEVIAILQTQPNKWFSPKEVSIRMNANQNTVSNYLKKLYKWREVQIFRGPGANQYRIGE